MQATLKKKPKCCVKQKKSAEVVKDKKIKQLWLNIVEDETRHHRILKELMEIIEKESTEWGRLPLRPHNRLP